nr:HK97 family phage prohead protease [uncultured Bacteroides sp.]
MKNTNIEQRYINSEIRALTTEEGSRTVEGYALIFNSLSELMQDEKTGILFKEIIAPEAITDEILKKSDIKCWLNHNEDRGILARNKFGKGSLFLSIDNKGLRYTFEAPKSALGEELLENLRRGDIDSSSFAFTIASGGDELEKQSDGTYIRTIKQFDRLHDCSPVYSPAYSSTSVKCRSLETAIEREKLEDYYNNLHMEIEEIIKDK